MAKCQIDETCVGKRKYSQGRRVRRAGFWFMTATEVLAGGKSGRTVWRMVEKRDAATCESFVRQVISNKHSEVITDGWKGYLGLGKKNICRHDTVEHKHEFVNARGKHTNNAEGCHNVVKSRLRKVFHNYGTGSSTVCSRTSRATCT